MISREGNGAFVIGLSATAVATALAVFSGGLGWIAAAVGCAMATLCAAWFFRDPERTIVFTEETILSAADGRVIAVDRFPNPFTGVDSQRIAVFLSLMDVHINRMPVAGTVTEVRHLPGRFRPGFDRLAAFKNERTEIRVEDSLGRTFVVRQIAGMLARRIVCRLTIGQTVTGGQRFGMIKFGSQVDLFLPDEATVLVGVGERVRAGQTAVARLPEVGERAR